MSKKKVGLHSYQNASSFEVIKLTTTYFHFKNLGELGAGHPVLRNRVAETRRASNDKNTNSKGCKIAKK